MISFNGLHLDCDNDHICLSLFSVKEGEGAQIRNRLYSWLEKETKVLQRCSFVQSSDVLLFVAMKFLF